MTPQAPKAAQPTVPRVIAFQKRFDAEFWYMNHPANRPKTIKTDYGRAQREGKK